jgi:ElaB/YqjD/DUF883 family membrane-anchored ribosome-binding protein
MTKKENAQELSRDIAATRQQIGQTLDALQSRLTPQHLLAEARDTVMDTTREKVEQAGQIAQATVKSAGDAITTTLAENPIIGAVVGAGLSWFATMGRSGGNAMDNQSQNPLDATVHRVQDTAGQVATTAQQIGSQVAGQAQQIGSQIAGQAQQVGGQVADQAQQLTTQVQQQAQQATSWLQHTYEENPLLVGAVAVAAGLAIGMAIPETPQENRLMGETRDQLVQKAQHVAQDTVHKVQAVTQEAAQAAKQAASQEAHNQGLTS